MYQKERRTCVYVRGEVGVCLILKPGRRGGLLGVLVLLLFYICSSGIHQQHCKLSIYLSIYLSVELLRFNLYLAFLFLLLISFCLLGWAKLFIYFVCFAFQFVCTCLFFLFFSNFIFIVSFGW